MKSFPLSKKKKEKGKKSEVIVILFVFRDALNCVIADNFPLKSSEFRVGSPKYNDYIAALNKVG